MVGGREVRQDIRGHSREAVNPDCLVGFDGSSADQFSQLPGRSPACEVHLKEAVLRVKEPCGAGDIRAAGTADRGDAEEVPLDAYWPRETGQPDLTLELWQAGAQGDAGPQPRDQKDPDEREGD